MTIKEITHIIERGEGLNAEFKISFCNDAIIALNAFANSEGGVVLIGVNNYGKIVGTTLNKESIPTWINAVKNVTEPTIIPNAEEFEIDGKTVVALSVKEFPIKPVALSGRYYKRIKNSNHQLSLSEISDLYLKTLNSSWDYYIDDQHSFDDISLDKILNFAQKSPRLSDEKDPLRLLQKYELVRNGQITKAAFLLFLKDFTVLTGIQAGRFKSPTKIIDSISIHSDLFSEVGEVMSFLRKHFMVEYIITGNPQREERYDYPEEAIREIVLNMIVHRDYRDGGDSIIKIFDDRIEFFNPGKLIGGLTIERLLSDNYSPKARNVLINTMFKEIGWVEKYGSGIQRIINACQEHGGVNIDFRAEQHGFIVVVTKKARSTDGTVEETGATVEKTVEKTESTVEKTDFTVEKTGNTVEKTVEETESTVEKTGCTVEKTVEKTDATVEETDTTVEKILEIITNNPQITQVQLVEMTGLTRRGIEWNLSKLKVNGLIERVGPDKGGYWKVIKGKLKIT